MKGSRNVKKQFFYLQIGISYQGIFLRCLCSYLMGIWRNKKRWPRLSVTTFIKYVAIYHEPLRYLLILNASSSARIPKITARRNPPIRRMKLMRVSRSPVKIWGIGIRANPNPTIKQVRFRLIISPPFNDRHYEDVYVRSIDYIMKDIAIGGKGYERMLGNYWRSNTNDGSSFI